MRMRYRSYLYIESVERMVQKGFPEGDGLRIPGRKLAERCLGGTFSSASTANIWAFHPVLLPLKVSVWD